MAALIRISVSPSTILIQHQKKPADPIRRCTRMVAHSTRHGIHLQIRSSSIKQHKVFEDISSGVVCYRDEKGEITCEGYDEGPRFHQMFSSFTSDQRDAEVIELLRTRLLEIVEDKSEAKYGGGGGADKDDFNSSDGFNTFY